MQGLVMISRTLTARHGLSCLSQAALRSCSSAAPELGSDSTTVQPDIVVVGAGCAGVACASALASEHVKTLLVERDPHHLGGRARSWPCPETGHPMHIGPHIVYSDYPNYFKLIKMLDPEGKERIVWQRQKDVFTTINGTSAYGDKSKFHSWPLALLNSSTAPWRIPPPLNWIPAVMKDPFVPSIWDALSLVPFGSFCMQLRGNNEIIERVLRRATPTSTSVDVEDDLRVWQRLDEISGQELLDAFGVSPAYQEHVMAFVANSILNVPLKEVSGAALVSWFRKLLGRPGVRLGFTDGGLGTVLEPVGSFLAEKQLPGTALRMGTQVTAVRRVQENGSSNLEVEMVDSASGQISRVRPKHGIVITLPPLEALKLIPDEDRNRPLERLLVNVAAADSDSRAVNVSDTPVSVLSRFKPCKYVSVYMWFDQDIRDPNATAKADASDPVAYSGHQFWAKRYDPADFCCEFYDYSKIYTRGGNTPDSVLNDLGIRPQKSPESSCISMVGVNMIDVDRLDPPNSGGGDPICSFPAPLSTPAARHLAVSAWSDEQLVEKAMGELRESIGEQLFNKEAKLLKGAVHRIPMAIPRMVVGTEMRRPVAGELHADSGVFLAGDYCQTGFMNCMEGATQAGFECADEVLQKIRGANAAAEALEMGDADATSININSKDVNGSSSLRRSNINSTNGGAAATFDRRWALPHPEISSFAHLVSRYFVWPASRWLWSNQLRKAEDIIRG